MVQLDTLKSSSIFNNLDVNEIECILKSHSFDVISYKKDQIIIHSGDTCKRLGIILKGSAAVLKSNINGRNTNFSVLKKSDVFGMANLFDNEPFNNTIKALNETKVFYISESTFKQIIMVHPEVGYSYIKLLTQKINFLTKRIDTYLSNEKSDGLYDYLLSLSKNKHSNEISIDISLSKLANMLHMSRSSLYRSFDELVAKKLITKKNKTITILEEII